jgi:hypothetical protein
VRTVGSDAFPSSGVTGSPPGRRTEPADRPDPAPPDELDAPEELDELDALGVEEDQDGGVAMGGGNGAGAAGTLGDGDVPPPYPLEPFSDEEDPDVDPGAGAVVVESSVLGVVSTGASAASVEAPETPDFACVSVIDQSSVLGPTHLCAGLPRRRPLLPVPSLVLLARPRYAR